MIKTTNKTTRSCQTTSIQFYFLLSTLESRGKRGIFAPFASRHTTWNLMSLTWTWPVKAKVQHKTLNWSQAPKFRREVEPYSRKAERTVTEMWLFSNYYYFLFFLPFQIFPKTQRFCSTVAEQFHTAQTCSGRGACFLIYILCKVAWGRSNLLLLL